MTSRYLIFQDVTLFQDRYLIVISNSCNVNIKQNALLVVYLKDQLTILMFPPMLLHSYPSFLNILKLSIDLSCL